MLQHVEAVKGPSHRIVTRLYVIYIRHEENVNKFSVKYMTMLNRPKYSIVGSIPQTSGVLAAGCTLNYHLSVIFTATMIIHVLELEEYHDSWITIIRRSLVICTKKISNCISHYPRIWTIFLIYILKKTN